METKEKGPNAYEDVPARYRSECYKKEKEK